MMLCSSGSLSSDYSVIIIVWCVILINKLIDCLCCIWRADGCPNGCGTHGTCRLFHTGWACTCMEGWKGKACQVAMETSCSSGDDEDEGNSSESINFYCYFYYYYYTRLMAFFPGQLG